MFVVLMNVVVITCRPEYIVMAHSVVQKSTYYKYECQLLKLIFAIKCNLVSTTIELECKRSS